jgi:hypothetical protein
MRYFEGKKRPGIIRVIAGQYQDERPEWDTLTFYGEVCDSYAIASSCRWRAFWSWGREITEEEARRLVPDLDTKIDAARAFALHPFF